MVSFIDIKNNFKKGDTLYIKCLSNTDLHGYEDRKTYNLTAIFTKYNSFSDMLVISTKERIIHLYKKFDTILNVRNIKIILNEKYHEKH